VRYGLTLPGCLLSVVTLAVLRQRVDSVLRRWLGLAAVAMSLYGLFGGMTPPPASLWPADTWNTEVFTRLTGLPIQLIRGMTALMLGLCLLGYMERLDSTLTLNRRRRRILVTLTFFLVFSIGGGWFSLNVVEQLTRTMLHGEITGELASLDSRIARGIYAADGAAMALAGMSHAQELFVPAGQRNQEEANRLVDRFAASITHGVVYLMDLEGTVIATSNRDHTDSFLGRNYRFRPYFQTAVAGHAGSYFAYGVTSGEPGYYASFPVTGAQGNVTGVAVVKKTLRSDELGFDNYSWLYLADVHGMVLLASHPDAILRFLWPLTPDQQQALEMSRQFGDLQLNGAAILNREIHPQDRLRWHRKSYVAGRRTINPDGWSLVLLQEEQAAPLLRLFGMSITLLLICIMGVAYLLLRQAELVDNRLRKLSRAVEQSPASVVITGANAAIEYVNPAFCTLTGYTAEEVMGQNPRILQSGLTSSEVYRQLWRAILQGWIWHGEFLNRKKNGELFWEEAVISPVSDEAGVVTHFLAIKEDITARKMAEQALRESESRFRQLAELSPIGVYLTDTDGNYLYLNQDWCRMSGLCQTGALVADWKNALHPEDRESTIALWDGWMANPAGRWELEYRLLDQDGKERWIWGLAAPLADDAGRITGFIGTSVDITERKIMESGMRAARERADAASQAKSTFLANMSHDIRTPMNSMLGMAELLLESPLDDEQRRMVQILNSAGETLLALISDILDLSKIEAGQLTLESVAIDLSDLVMRIVDLLSEAARRKGLSLHGDVAAELPRWVYGDPVRLRQVLLNLVGNAIKFTGTGEVVVRVTRQGDGPDCLFTISDTGIGVPADRLDSIFQPFVQVDASTTRRYGGTGLGLAICQELVSAMGGTLQVESEEGIGSRFYFTLPLAAAPAPIPEEPAPAPGPVPVPAASSLSILLVDDSPDNRVLIEVFLEKTRHRLDLAVNGVEAVGKCLAQRYDVVLMDVQMPVMDGYTATRRIRAHELEHGLPPMPIFALTAHAMKEDEARSLAAGCSGHLVKPIRKKLLLETLDALVVRI
jgi:nitrogen fixation negative regulator NifL